MSPTMNSFKDKSMVNQNIIKKNNNKKILQERENINEVSLLKRLSCCA